jgi:hypothetical protein
MLLRPHFCVLLQHQKRWWVEVIEKFGSVFGMDFVTCVWLQCVAFILIEWLANKKINGAGQIPEKRDIKR